MLYRLLIVIATIIWGSSFVIVKDVTGFLTTGWLLVIRFSVAAVLLALVFAKKRDLYLRRDHILFGGLFGVALFLAYYVQTQGLIYTTPGKNAFLTGTYCVLVPFFAWFATRKRPTLVNVGAALLCLVGVGLVSLSGDLTVNIGDALTLLCAVFYALHIVLVSKFSQDRDIFVLTMWQFAGVALCALVVALLTEPAPVVLTQLDAGQFAQLAYLAVACTTLALLFQNVGQKHLPPASASLLLSLESPFGVAFSVAFGAEALNGQVLCGFVLIFAAIMISEVLPEYLAKAKGQG
ncbi:MAG: DMT family transporter, partial [Coriobacteriia bacterium]|nr:DMT family transporter [Coriobacteriia bacterium]